MKTKSAGQIEVYLEIGKKRTFAGALEWPGWCRSGRDEASAMEALLAYAPRFAGVLQAARIEFQLPADVSAFTVIERLEGNATTDFGAPDVSPSKDSLPVDDAELQRFLALLAAYWQAFDAAAHVAIGKELCKGPRGGGRDLESIQRHVLGADAGYLASLGWKIKSEIQESLEVEFSRIRQSIQEALIRAAHGETPERGPRGGIRWTARRFIRRSSWHILDHAWEIEDRIE